MRPAKPVFSQSFAAFAGTLAFFIAAGTLPLSAQQATPATGGNARTNAAPRQAAKKLFVRNLIFKNEGGPEIDEALIAAHVSLKPGSEYTRPEQSKTIRSLFETGLFDFVTVDPILDPEQETLDIQISYVARPLLVGIYFEGNKEWEGGTPEAQSEYEQIIVNDYDSTKPDSENAVIGFFRGKLIKECTDAGMTVGAPLDRSLVMRSAEKIKKKYEAKFPFVKVSPQIKVDKEKGTATVTFVIEENLNTRITEIKFIGNKSFDDMTLRNVMQTSTWAYTFDFSEWPGNRFLKFSPIRDLGRFNYATYQRDLVELTNFYQNNGFLDVQVYGQPREELEEGYSFVNNTETEGDLPLEITISEGMRYFVDEIQICGNDLGKEHARFSQQAIVAMLAQYSPRGVRRGDDVYHDLLFPGMAYSPRAVEVATEKIRDYYGQVGYLNCRVSVTREPDVDTGKVVVKFKIVEGEKSYLRSVKIEGNTTTKSEIILRELVLAPGEVFDMVRMKTSESRLKNTSYFRQPNGQSTISLRPADTPIPGQKDLVVSVTEAPTGSFNFGGGFSTVESLSAYIEFSESNFDIFNYRNYFRGGGQKFRFRIQVGTNSSTIEQSFEEPMVFGREIAVGYDAYYKSDSYVSSSYNTVDAGVKIYGRRRLFERVYGTLYYKIDNYEIKDIEWDVPQFIWDEAGYTLLSRGGLSLSRDTRDSYLFPNSGTKIVFTNELVGGPFGGDCTYYKMRLDAARWFPIFDYQDQTVKLRMRADTAHAFGDSYVPFFEKIKYGGPYNLRGFRYAHVGPFVEDEPLGGDSGAFISAEYTIKLLEQLRFALFYDGGFVNEDSFDFSPREWNDDVGFGFRMLVWGALLNLDIGFPIHTSEENDDGMRFNISFGTSF